jgi:hypothetical protein
MLNNIMLMNFWILTGLESLTEIFLDNDTLLLNKLDCQ